MKIRIQQNKISKTSRLSQGQSLIELLVATLVMAAAATVCLGLYSLNTREFSGFWNKGEAITGAADALARIGLFTRCARSLGDSFGNMPPNTGSVFPMSTTSGKAPSASDKAKYGYSIASSLSGLTSGQPGVIAPWFPSAGNPYYTNGSGTAVLPASVYGGSWPWSTGTQVQLGPPSGPTIPTPGMYQLAQDTLILQLPVFVGTPPTIPGLGNDPGQDTAAGTNQGPYIWPATWDGQPTQAQDNMLAVDTYVIRVLPDPSSSNPPTYMMQEAVFPACPAGGAIPAPFTGTYTGHPTNAPSNMLNGAPLTILKGIVGPVDSNGNISVFSYVEKINNTSTTMPAATGAVYVTDYTGVIVNLEVIKNQMGSKASVSSFKTEFFIRNNSQCTLIGPGS